MLTFITVNFCEDGHSTLRISKWSTLITYNGPPPRRYCALWWHVPFSVPFLSVCSLEAFDLRVGIKSSAFGLWALRTQAFCLQMEKLSLLYSSILLIQQIVVPFHISWKGRNGEKKERVNKCMTYTWGKLWAISIRNLFSFSELEFIEKKVW